MGRAITFSRSDTRNIIHLFEKDRVSTVVIGKQYGVTCNTIIKLLREEGIEVNLSERRKVHFTDNQRKDIVNRYDCGYGESTTIISKVYNCSVPTIRRVLKEEEVYDTRIKHDKIYFTESEISEILNLYAEGDSAKGISKIFDCSDSVILSVLREQGIDTNDYGRGKRRRLVVDRGLWKTCRGLSRVIYKNHRDTINPQRNKISKYGYHLDHKIPISVGYHSDLTVLDLAHPCNLQVIPAFDNLSKHIEPSISRRTLLDSIKYWNKEQGDPFTDIDMEIKYSFKYGRYRFFGGDYRYNWGVR